MSSLAISVDHICKKYYLAGQQPRPTRVYEVVRNKLGIIKRRLLRQQSLTGKSFEPFWALRDISFTVNRGEVLGIIGRNGSGKSTLLKILSRITDPSSGRAEFYGRLGSLLEVGTGFHPELSGRENVFLNGTILGMRRSEIEQKFDQIVEFSGIGQFLDTPVKHYSSGMYVRLAFSVAAHLEPEILLLDEVLAVGDMEFTKKSLDKMLEVVKDGTRTVVFVSHAIKSVEKLCTRTIVLDHGEIIFDGPTSEAIDVYLTLTNMSIDDIP